MEPQSPAHATSSHQHVQPTTTTTHGTPFIPPHAGRVDALVTVPAVPAALPMLAALAPLPYLTPPPGATASPPSPQREPPTTPTSHSIALHTTRAGSVDVLFNVPAEPSAHPQQPALAPRPPPSPRLEATACHPTLQHDTNTPPPPHGRSGQDITGVAVEEEGG